MSDFCISDGRRSGRGAKMADYVAAEALDSEGEPIEPNQPKKSQVVHHAKHSRKPHAKKLKPDAGV